MDQYTDDTNERTNKKIQHTNTDRERRVSLSDEGASAQIKTIKVKNRSQWYTHIHRQTHKWNYKNNGNKADLSIFLNAFTVSAFNFDRGFFGLSEKSFL